MRLSAFILFFIVALTSNAQNYKRYHLIEEFTNVSSQECYDQSQLLNPVLSQYNQDVLVIKYHTDFPGQDIFNGSDPEAVSDKLDEYDITTVPSVVVNGNIRPKGNFPTGESGNVTGDFLNTLPTEYDMRFFGVRHELIADNSKLAIASGWVKNSMLDPIQGYHTIVMVEEQVILEDKIGVGNQNTFNYVFRKMIQYKKSETINVGSYHGWDAIDIPEEAQNLNNIGFVHYFTDWDGNVLNCAYSKPINIPSYKVQTKIIKYWPENRCDYVYSPKLEITNDGIKSFSKVRVKLDINGSISYFDFERNFQPKYTFHWHGEDVVLPPGQVDVRITVDKIYEAECCSPVYDNDVAYQTLYLIDFLPLLDEDFESGLDAFIVNAQNDDAFKAVNGQGIGGFGLSNNAVVIDYWNWEYDEETAGNIYINNNPNFAYMHYANIDLSTIENPILIFDVTGANKHDGTRILSVSAKAYNESCNYYKGVEWTYDPEDVTFGDYEHDKLYVPNENSVWETKSIDLSSLQNETSVEIQLKAFQSWKKLNAVYIDNIRIVSQNCLEEGLSIENQDDLSNFNENYPFCKYIEGDVTIDNSSSNIESLQGLKEIKAIYGDLNISDNNNLVSLMDLNSIETYLGSINIQSNDQLESLEGLNIGDSLFASLIVENNPSLSNINTLSSLKYIQDDFIVESNESLQSLEALDSLWSIDGIFRISNCDDINSLEGLNALNSIAGNLEVYDMDGLVGVEGISSLEEVGGDLLIQENDMLESISGFQNLQAIQGGLSLSDNLSLSNIDILTNIQSLGGFLQIQNNASLESIEALDNIDPITIESNDEDLKDLTLVSNPKLALCNTDMICEFLKIQGKEYEIYENQNCLDIEEIFESCQITSLSETAESKTHFYPNPAHSKLYYESLDKMDIYIYSIDGRLIFETTIEKGKQSLDISDLKKGVYILKGINQKYRLNQTILVH